MLDTDPLATVDDLEHDLADLDEAELHVEPPLNGGSTWITEDEATAAMAAVLAPPSRTRWRCGSSEGQFAEGDTIRVDAQNGELVFERAATPAAVA